MKNRKVSGRLILEEIQFDECLECKVCKVSGGSSAKVYVPISWEGAIVYVVKKKQGEQS